MSPNMHQLCQDNDTRNESKIKQINLYYNDLYAIKKTIKDLKQNKNNPRLITVKPTIIENIDFKN